MFEKLNSTTEAYLGLCALGTQGATDVGSFNLQLEAQQRTFTSGIGPLRKTRGELLPIPLKLAKPFLQTLGNGTRSDVSYVVEGALGVLAALNFLHGVGWTDRPVFPPAKVILCPGHQKVLRNLWCSVYTFFERGEAPFELDAEISSLRERSSDYSGGTVSVRRKLIAEKVIPAWPKEGHACVLPISQLVDEELKAELESPDSILLPESEWPLVTPVSKVHASEDEWYRICQAGHARGMFTAFPEEKIFRNNFGEKVMAGAMGVDKVKVVEGKKVNLLRFICILCPINAYMRQLKGDSWSLPQSSLLASLILDEGEYVWQDGEDLESCFNLFTIPDAWLPYFVFSKPVASSAFGGRPGGSTYVAIRAVAMGGINSVAWLQNFLRNLLFKTLRVPAELEVNPRQKVLSGDAVIGCIDGADYLTRLRMIAKTLRRWDGEALPAAGERHPVMKGFVDACCKLGLPINVGKEVIQEFQAAILGGELDGIRGTLGVAAEKGHKFVGKTCALLSVRNVAQVACQHWAGVYCFAAGFRRPMFSVLEQFFTFIVEFEAKDKKMREMPNAVRDEALVAGLLIPLATTNLRAPVRKTISISDASEVGGASAEATRFVSALDQTVERRVTG